MLKDILEAASASAAKIKWYDKLVAVFRAEASRESLDDLNSRLDNAALVFGVRYICRLTSGLPHLTEDRTSRLAPKCAPKQQSAVSKLYARQFKLPKQKLRPNYWRRRPKPSKVSLLIVPLRKLTVAVQPCSIISSDPCTPPRITRTRRRACVPKTRELTSSRRWKHGRLTMTARRYTGLRDSQEPVRRTPDLDS